jgi:5-formyltetrahydrofolate cyclo-ligase
VNAADRKAMRREMRAMRQAVPAPVRRQAASRAARSACRQGWLRPGRHIGLYAPMPEEFDCTALTSRALSAGCSVFLPRILHWGQRRMEFARLTSDSMRLNRHGLAEPESECLRLVSARRLDVVFVPLVAVDPSGTRLGMGAGFYDRYFAFRQSRPGWRRPLLIGLAYDFQRVRRIERASWDVPLDAVLTEIGIFRTGRNTRWRDLR